MINLEELEKLAKESLIVCFSNEDKSFVHSPDTILALIKVVRAASEVARVIKYTPDHKVAFALEILDEALRGIE
jgi:hypothetical protein